jgi:hypothetical protein
MGKFCSDAGSMAPKEILSNKAHIHARMEISQE